MAQRIAAVKNGGSFQTVDHTADWAIEVHGSSLEQLFLYAALGMNSLMIGDFAKVSGNTFRNIQLAAEDTETLLVDWLSELAYWAESEQLIFNQFSFNEFEPGRLDGTAFGGAVSSIEKHIKAVTYHELKIIETESGWKATIIFDV